MKILFTFLLALPALWMHGQNIPAWPDGRQALIVLTYDDALDSQLDIALPQLDQAGFKATFFLKEPSTEQQLDRWCQASRNGHELGNHTVYHPCMSNLIKTDPRYHAENYTVGTILREIGSMNKLLYAMDHQATHTYAYPCAETSVGGKSYVDSLRKCGFVPYARSGGAFPIITDFKTLDPFLVPCMAYDNKPSGAEIIDFVKRVQESKGMGVFIFHGVGGDYLEVSAQAHQQLIRYLKEHNKEIWVTTFRQAMDFVTKNRAK
jgi:peptidoglycan/xylan/chitin deacetylase (PgdA/CDA1 family)